MGSGIQPCAQQALQNQNQGGETQAMHFDA